MNRTFTDLTLLYQSLASKIGGGAGIIEMEVDGTTFLTLLAEIRERNSVRIYPNRERNSDYYYLVVGGVKIKATNQSILLSPRYGTII